MSLEELSKLIRDKPVVYKENPHWSFDEKINHKDGRPFSLADYEEVLSFVKSYFVQVWNSFETEAQVLVVPLSQSLRLCQLPRRGSFSGANRKKSKASLKREREYHPL